MVRDKKGRTGVMFLEGIVSFGARCQSYKIFEKHFIDGLTVFLNRQICIIGTVFIKPL